MPYSAIRFQSYKIALADRYIDQGEAEKAISLLNEVLTDDPKNADAIFSLTSLYYQNHEFDKAKALCLPLLFQVTYASNAKFHLGRIAFAQDESENALFFFQQLLIENPNQPSILVWYARSQPHWNHEAKMALQESTMRSHDDAGLLFLILCAYCELLPQKTEHHPDFEAILSKAWKIFFQLDEAQYFNDAMRLDIQLYLWSREEKYFFMEQALNQYEYNYPDNHQFDHWKPFIKAHLITTEHVPQKPSSAKSWIVALLIAVGAILPLFLRNQSTQPNRIHFPISTISPWIHSSKQKTPSFFPQSFFFPSPTPTITTLLPNPWETSNTTNETNYVRIPLRNFPRPLNSFPS